MVLPIMMMALSGFRASEGDSFFHRKGESEFKGYPGADHIVVRSRLGTGDAYFFYEAFQVTGEIKPA